MDEKMNDKTVITTEPKIKIIGWSGGVQSTAMAVMSALGEIEPVDALIYADIGNEWSIVTKIMDWYRDWFKEHGVRAETVHPKKSVLEDLENGDIYIPAYTESGGPLNRGCIWRYKIQPMRWRMRELAGYDATKPPHPKAGEVEMWMGMTTDEMRRTFPSLKKYIVHRYPLIEKDMTRGDTIRYLRGLGLPIPPKTSCVICPYRRAMEWIPVRDQTPDEWQKAIEIDKKIRYAISHRKYKNKHGIKDFKNRIYLWREGIPLEEADLDEFAKNERDYDEEARIGELE